jgi:hypothetical protein
MPRILFGFSLFVCDTATTLLTLLNGWGAIAIIFVSVVSSISTLIVSSSLGSLIWPTYFWDTPQQESSGVCEIADSGQSPSRSSRGRSLRPDFPAASQMR